MPVKAGETLEIGIILKKNWFLRNIYLGSVKNTNLVRPV